VVEAPDNIVNRCDIIVGFVGFSGSNTRRYSHESSWTYNDMYYMNHRDGIAFAQSKTKQQLKII